MTWVRLLSSDAVARSSIVGVTVDARDLVVWRDSRGYATVMAARCPHEWSPLAIEGVVDGDELVCTAHFWRFDCEGRGSKVNVKGRRDPKGDTVVFACREVDGGVEADLDRDLDLDLDLDGDGVVSLRTRARLSPSPPPIPPNQVGG